MLFAVVLTAGLVPYTGYADVTSNSIPPNSDDTQSAQGSERNESISTSDSEVELSNDENDEGSASTSQSTSSSSVLSNKEEDDGVASSSDQSSSAFQRNNSSIDYSEGKLAVWAAGIDGADVREVYPPDGLKASTFSSRAAAKLTPMSFTEELLYFCKYESSQNYDQGLSSGDNYHAMGYFQFDNRYGLGDFLKAVYEYSPQTYSSLKVIGDRYNWSVSGETRENGAFTQLGNDLNTAWHVAYAANPSEFSELQNGWAYEDSYNGPTGARKNLAAMGVNIDGRQDCVKGLVWGMTNLFGGGGGTSYINNGQYYGANYFFKNSGINDSMSDTEFVTVLCNYVIDNVAKRYPNQTQYHKGWQNRYKSELKDCLSYIAANTVEPPSNVTAEPAGDGEILLKWDAVKEAEAYAVAEYVDGGYRTYTTALKDTSYTVSNLSNGKPHSFLVQARVGGKWSAVSKDLHVTATPEGATKPQVTATAGNGSVTLTWEKVSGATKYAIASRNEDGSYKTYSLSCDVTTYTINGLSNGRSYDFLVQAWTGSWSNFDSSDLVSAVPMDATSPSNVTAEPAGDGEILLKWDAVKEAEAYAVAEYVDGGYRTYTTALKDTSYTVSNLSNGKPHSFLVQARVGGKWSAVSKDLHVTATPEGATKPQVTATAGNGSVTLTWEKVSGATKYAIAREGSTVAVTTDETSFTASGLKNGTKYGFRVRALIDGEWSNVSDDVAWATPRSDTAPHVVASQTGQTSVQLIWDAVKGAQKYAIAVKTTSGYKTYTLNCTDTSYEVKDLSIGSSYSFLVQAYVNGSWSSFSNADLTRIALKDSTAPTAKVAVYGKDSVTLSWDEVSGATKYAIAEYLNGSYKTFTLDCRDTSYTMSNVGVNTKHRYLVQAYVNGSWSKFSEDNLVEAMIVSSTSPQPKAEATGDGEITLSWSAVQGATKYAVAEYAGGRFETYTTQCRDLAYKVDDLGNGYEHKFLVQAYVNGSWSSYSLDLLVSATPHGTVSPKAKAEPGDLSAKVSWTRVPGATKYAVAALNGDGSFTTYTYSAMGTSYTVDGLVSGRAYNFVVQAYVNGTWSPFSSIDYARVVPTGVNIPEGQRLMTGIANSGGFSSATPYLILVDTSRKEVGVFTGGRGNWRASKFWDCVTGASSTPTIKGVFQTTGYKKTNLSTDSRARWCTQIYGGYFFHSILASESELGGSLSHGCVRLKVANAKWLYDNLPSRTKVYIY